MDKSALGTTPVTGRLDLRVVGIGGTTRADSSSEKALKVSLRTAEEAGAQTQFFGASYLSALPHYDPTSQARSLEAQELISAARGADGLIIASPGYHGSISGLLKNALDYMEDMREDDRCYLTGRAVGCIVTAAGWQSAVSTLLSLRSVVHALRGWPTPMGATLNTAVSLFDSDGSCIEDHSRMQLEEVGREVVAFALMSRGPSTQMKTGSIL